jgi:hypothetical protein
MKNQLINIITSIIGICILFLQVWKYYNNTLELSINEIILTIVALLLLKDPNKLINFVKTKIQ